MEPTLNQDQQDAIKGAIFAGRKIEAIKLFREATGASLLDAKNFVERLEEALRASSPELFTAAKGKGCGMAVLAFAVIVGVGATAFL